MSRRTLLPLLIVCLVLTAGCSFFGPNPDSYSSSYDLSVGVDADETLRNVTIRVPLPQVDGNATFEATDVAPNGTFDARVVETEYGPMLELTTDEFTVETRYYRYVEADGVGRQEEISEAEYDPENPNHAKRTRRTASTSALRDATYPIETRTPVGTSPTFYGDGVTRSLTDCSLPYRDETACFTYDAPVFLSYDAPATARVDASVMVVGSNEWFSGGWTGNSYADRVHANATGPQDRWVSASGHTETGRGNYPSPER
ncbi:hypothetical protein [Haloarcula pellucida]|uniref:Lipoprotein n=1 Tax=Haloarcula pellucida TaxID=1427151 RepID=A0A830GG03_9EURY|nr:hypothetical protein [Halomicroarcula pellucida]MBX0347035.1 hypothetical protein [Halomicroarcula pellucida]GGN86658.1 hypothetical protein GCM10009030_04570 [Halomicroarcula pellucida]